MIEYLTKSFLFVILIILNRELSFFFIIERLVFKVDLSTLNMLKKLSFYSKKNISTKLRRNAQMPEWAFKVASLYKGKILHSRINLIFFVQVSYIRPFFKYIYEPQKFLLI